MSAEATNASDLPAGLPHTAAQPSLSDRAQRVVAGIEQTVRGTWIVSRYVFFVIFLLLATLAFWLGVLSSLVGLIRRGINAVMWLFLWLAGGMPPRPGAPVGTVAALQQDVQRWWEERALTYEAMLRPVATHLIVFRHLGRTFWHWSWAFRGVAMLVFGLTVAVPALYLVPRPHDVQITDDNAVEHDPAANRTIYLVHALDMYDVSKHREYLNEDTWYLGKINSQGLKSQLIVGRTYRLWVVGLRWYYMPKIYPNILWATEIDAQGAKVKKPAGVCATPSCAPPAKP